jgi:hypothetical protein
LLSFSIAANENSAMMESDMASSVACRAEPRWM